VSKARWRKLCLVVAGLTLGCVVYPSDADSSADFTYDLAGRLTTALYDNNGCVAYVYDANGNRTSQTNTISSAPETATWGSGVLGCFKWSP
jgi:YD repeat-containing protein